jgi:hypothetical protein
MIHESDGIAWSELSHAYGQADDVTGWLADMASADAKSSWSSRRRMRAARRPPC